MSDTKKAEKTVTHFPLKSESGTQIIKEATAPSFLEQETVVRPAPPAAPVLAPDPGTQSKREKTQVTQQTQKTNLGRPVNDGAPTEKADSRRTPSLGLVQKLQKSFGGLRWPEGVQLPRKFLFMGAGALFVGLAIFLFLGSASDSKQKTPTKVRESVESDPQTAPQPPTRSRTKDQFLEELKRSMRQSKS